MSDIRTLISDLRRPRLLLRAARFGAADYRRDRDLKRLLQGDALPAPEQTLPRLIDEEGRLEQTRRSGDASYSLTRHIDILIALIAELHLIPKPGQMA